VECSGTVSTVALRCTCVYFPRPAAPHRLSPHDLDGFEIEAVGHNVAKVSYATA